MLSNEDFVWEQERGKEIKATMAEVESVYSPAFNVVVKNPQIKQSPKRVLAIKTYKVTFPMCEAFVDIIEFVGKDGCIEQYYNTKSHTQLNVVGLDFGKLQTTIF